MFIYLAVLIMTVLIRLLIISDRCKNLDVFLDCTAAYSTRRMGQQSTITAQSASTIPGMCVTQLTRSVFLTPYPPQIGTWNYHNRMRVMRQTIIKNC